MEHANDAEGWPPPKFTKKERKLVLKKSLPRLPRGLRRISLRLNGSAFTLNIQSGGIIAKALEFRDATRRFYRNCLVLSLAVMLVSIVAISRTTTIYEGQVYSSLPDQLVLPLLLVGPISTIATVAFWMAYSWTSTINGIYEQFITVLENIDGRARIALNGVPSPTQGSSLNRSLAELANLIARQPNRISTGDTNVQNIAFRKAASIAEVQRWVSTPLDSNSYWFASVRVSSELVSWLGTGWHVLVDERPADGGSIHLKTPKAPIVWWLLGFVACVASVVLAVGFSGVISWVSPILILLLIALALLCLTKAGLPLAAVKENMDLARSLKSEITNEPGSRVM